MILFGATSIAFCGHTNLHSWHPTHFFPFKTGLNNIEKILNSYEKEIGTENNLEELINYVLKLIRKKMIIFVITDIDGMYNISEKTLKQLAYRHDVIFINISDTFITGDNSFDIEKDCYIPKFFLIVQIFLFFAFSLNRS